MNNEDAFAVPTKKDGWQRSHCSGERFLAEVRMKTTGCPSTGQTVYDSVLCRTSRSNSCFGWLSFLPRSVR
jgi:hypothetical protein